jgi:hypothetical protein
MLGVSGIVPDGVEAVFVTAADGTATRADVRDNGYAFVLAPPRRPEPRYVVGPGATGRRTCSRCRSCSWPDAAGRARGSSCRRA